MKRIQIARNADAAIRRFGDEGKKTVCPCIDAAARPRCALRGLPGWAGQSLTQGGRAMEKYSEVFVGMDVSKSRIAVGLAEGGGAGEARFLGEIEASEASVTKFVRRLRPSTA